MTSRMGLSTRYYGSALRPALSATLLVLAGLLAAFDATAGERRTIVSENAGRVCIWRGHTGGGAEIMFRPALGCLGSSCTRPVGQSFAATVRDGRIAMTGRFVVSVATGNVNCTKDCGGAGGATTTLIHLEPGTYRLTLGGKDIGTVDTDRLKGDPFNRICFGTRKRPGGQ